MHPIAIQFESTFQIIIYPGRSFQLQILFLSCNLDRDSVDDISLQTRIVVHMWLAMVRILHLVVRIMGVTKRPAWQ